MPDVPFLCDFPRAITLTTRDPYGEIVRYLKVHRDTSSQAFQTLAYFDGVHPRPVPRRRRCSRWR